MSIAIEPAIEPVVSALPSPAVDFTRRHIGPSPREIHAMLETICCDSIEDLIAQTTDTNTVPFAKNGGFPVELWRSARFSLENARRGRRIHISIPASR